MNTTKFIEAFKELNYSFNKSNLTCLDLGCENTLNLSFLHYYINFKKLFAVDKEVIDQIDYRLHNEVSDDVPLSYINNFSETDAIDFFTQVDNNFDLIILSNFLHLFDKNYSEIILDQCIKRLNQDGIIYILIANKEHRGWENKNNHNYKGPLWGMTLNEITDFIKPLKIIWKNQFEHKIEVFCK